MEKRRLNKYLVLPVIILLIVVISPLNAEPLQQEGNLLNNGGFEQPFVNGTAEGWSTWALQTEKTEDTCLDGYHYLPKWNVETGGNFVAGGATSQYIGNNWDTWSAGVTQTVDATPGVTYRFSFAAKGRATNEPSPDPSDFGINMNVRAGIDPNGSGLWNDADVVWGAAGSPHDAWQTFTVEATATGDKISVFTSADFGVPGTNQCRQFIDTWYDNAELVAVSQAPPPPPPADTPPPAPAPTQAPEPEPTAAPEATAEGDEVAEAPEEEPDQEPEPEQEPEPTQEAPPESEAAGGGTICVNAFHDENANGLLDENEGYMAGVTILVAGESEVIGQGISDGSDTPVCFQGLEPGPYQVAQQLPGRLEMTTAGNALVAATDNHTIVVAFGSRIRQEGSVPGDSGPAETGQDESGAAEEAAPEEGLDPLSLSGLIVILLGVVLLGLLLFFLLRR